MFVELHPKYAELVKGIKACLNVEFARTSLRSAVTSGRIGTGHFAIPPEFSLLSFRTIVVAVVANWPMAYYRGGEMTLNGGWGLWFSNPTFTISEFFKAGLAGDILVSL